MNDIATLTAQPKKLMLNGKTYEFHPLTFHDFGKLQAWIDTQFPDPMELFREEAASGAYTVKQEQFLMKTALELKSRAQRKLGTPEADELMNSMEGVQQLIMLSLRKGDPDLTEDDAKVLAENLRLGDIAAIFDATDLDKVVNDPKAGPGTDGAKTTKGRPRRA